MNISATDMTVRAVLVLVGVVHLLPLSGAIGVERLAALYNLTIIGPDMEIILRHRAVLFGILGTFLIFAAANRNLQAPALIAGFISVGSFVWLAHSVGGFNAAIDRVYRIDLVLLGLLCVAAAAFVLQKKP